MAWLIYAVLRSRPPLALLSGVDGAQLEFVDGARLCAAVSRHPQEPSAVVPAALAFGRAVAVLFQHGAIVPMRFPTCLDSADAVCTWLDTECDAYMELLQLVDGCVEMGLRIQFSDEPRAQPRPLIDSPGHAYLATRAEPVCAALSQGERVAATLLGLYRSWQFDGLVEGFASLSFLVTQPALEDFLNQCRRTARQTRLPLYVSGPWPPYSFAAHPNSPRLGLHGAIAPPSRFPTHPDLSVRT
jgi:hypothetical protein